MRDRGWAVMIPVKPAAAAKSRLGDDARRGDIARALALDTIDVATRAAGVARVLVVTADAALADLLPGGVELIRERAATGIDAALAAASARVGL
ncbi:2-phospho-L-lactate guanylyltransferase, partial [Microbacterium sp. CnD16-F]|nr:2-phospho-L-lactate guanylyltransferase [Microbacterium sp. CnD16-F]